MIDKVRILVQAGDGGDGCESFQRRNDKKIVPTGGDGGNGGNIVFRVDPNAPPVSRLRFKRHIISESGGHGGSNHKRGKNGSDYVVLVPLGTRLFNLSDDLLIRDLVHEKEEVIVVRGGAGGRGNFGDKKQTRGERGEKIDLEVTVRLHADVCLVGLPNSGKSKILTQLTRSQVKPESYPFSTHSPELGVLKFSDFEQVTLCDIPSLYAGSHEGRGLGNHFLKHLEFARLVLYVVDPFSEFAPSLQEGFELLRNEIKLYNKDLLNIPSAIVINKMDLPGAEEKVKNEKWKPKRQVYKISALTGEGIDKLSRDLEKLV